MARWECKIVKFKEAKSNYTQKENKIRPLLSSMKKKILFGGVYEQI